jgi:hypothetical protein
MQRFQDRTIRNLEEKSVHREKLSDDQAEF